MRNLFGTLALAAFLLAPSQAEAQVGFGGTASLLDYLGGSAFGIGGHVEAPLPGLHENMSILGEGILYLEGTNPIEINANLLYHFPLENGSVTPFGSAGLSYITDEGYDDTGLTLGGGVKFGEGEVLPSAGLRLHLTRDFTDFFIYGSFTVGLGG